MAWLLTVLSDESVTTPFPRSFWRLPQRSQPRKPAFSAFATVWADLHMHQCLVAAFALVFAKKKRIISRLASGPRASV